MAIRQSSPRQRLTTIGVALGALVIGLNFMAVPPIAALVAGAVIAVTIGCSPTAGPMARHLLAASVVALGCGLELGEVAAAAADGAFTVTSMLAGTFGCGYLLARRFQIAPDVAILVTAGTAICGGSAIAAIAPLLAARSRDVAAAVSIVFALNAVALLVFPAIGLGLDLDAESFGRWCALAIHDMSSVVGAATIHGDAALSIATVTKLARIAWLVPIGFLIVHFRKRQHPVSRTRPAFPWFLLAFLGASSVRAGLPELQPIGDAIADLAPKGMTLALFAVGLGIDRTQLRSLTARSWGFGLALWVALAVTALAYLLIERALA